jgi:hypothetical protein
MKEESRIRETGPDTGLARTMGAKKATVGGS